MVEVTDLASLAVYNGDIVAMCSKPVTDVLAESLHQFNARRIVIIEWKMLNVSMETRRIIAPLGTATRQDAHTQYVGHRPTMRCCWTHFQVTIRNNNIKKYSYLLTNNDI